jgi:hypothetical protein
VRPCTSPQRDPLTLSEVLQRGLEIDAAPAHIEGDGVAVVLPLGAAAETVPALATIAANVEAKGAGVVGVGVQRADRSLLAVKDGAGLLGQGAQIEALK